MHADTDVGAVAESNVGLSFSEDIETLELVPPALVVVGAAEVDRHRCASGNRYLAELSVTGCLAHEVQQRGFPPDAFLDGLGARCGRSGPPQAGRCE